MLQYFSFRMREIISTIADFLIVHYEENGALSSAMCASGNGKVLLSPRTYDINLRRKSEEKGGRGREPLCLWRVTDPAL